MRQETAKLGSGERLTEETIGKWKRIFQEGGFKSGIFHIYAGRSDREELSEIMETLMQGFPDMDCVGTESGGEISNNGPEEPCVLISAMFFDSSSVSTEVFGPLAGHEKEIGENARRSLNRRLADDLKAAELLLPGSMLNTSDMYAEMSHCDPDICIFGGYSGNRNAELPKAFVMRNGEFFEDAMIIIEYCGKDFQISASKSAGWRRLGRPMRITKASGHILEEIDGKPAAETYRRYLNISMADGFAEEANEFPLMVNADGDDLLRHANAVLDDGSLRLSGSVKTGWKVCLTFGNPSEILADVNERLLELHTFDPQAILIYSCYVRKLFWEKSAGVELRPFGKLAPTAGFHTFGEVLRSENTGNVAEYNITLLTIGMREGPPERRENEAPQADASAMSGQASLIRRLAELVSSTTEELNRSFEELRSANEKLRYVAEHDALTGLLSRGKTETVITDTLRCSKETARESSLIMFDVDRFKDVNDRYGHSKGDEVLKEIAGIVLSMIDQSRKESAGRWGGEEFFIILPNCERRNGLEFAERFRRAVEMHIFQGIPEVTVSVGFLAVKGDEVPEEAYRMTDAALYRAKAAGRNRVAEARAGI